MSFWGIVINTSPNRQNNCRGQLDTIFNDESSCQRYRGAAVLSNPPKSHEINALLPN